MTLANRAGGSDGLPTYAEDWCFFLDVDGTLLDIASTPDSISVDAALTNLLAMLSSKTGGAMALISGRTIADLDRMFSPIRFVAAGQHGVQRRDAQGRIHRHAARQELLRSVSKRLFAFADARPGLVFEDKGETLALHFRQAPHLAGEVRDVVDAARRMLGGVYEMQAGKMVFEIKPTGYDKGSAIEDYMQEYPFAGRRPVFIGDDLTDEYGFCMVNALGGHSIKVGHGSTQAQSYLEDAAAVRAWLAGWMTFSMRIRNHEADA